MGCKISSVGEVLLHLVLRFGMLYHLVMNRSMGTLTDGENSNNIRGHLSKS